MKFFYITPVIFELIIIMNHFLPKKPNFVINQIESSSFNDVINNTTTNVISNQLTNLSWSFFEKFIHQLSLAYNETCHHWYDDNDRLLSLTATINIEKSSYIDMIPHLQFAIKNDTNFTFDDNYLLLNRFIDSINFEISKRPSELYTMFQPLLFIIILIISIFYKSSFIAHNLYYLAFESMVIILTDGHDSSMFASYYESFIMFFIFCLSIYIAIIGFSFFKQKSYKICTVKIDDIIDSSSDMISIESSLYNHDNDYSISTEMHADGESDLEIMDNQSHMEMEHIFDEQLLMRSTPIRELFINHRHLFPPLFVHNEYYHPIPSDCCSSISSISNLNTTIDSKQTNESIINRIHSSNIVRKMPFKSLMEQSSNTQSLIKTDVSTDHDDDNNINSFIIVDSDGEID
nr:uncharacterized protein LOC124497495 [Dermatophagoides farinae]